jgi:hypothetical protein
MYQLQLLTRSAPAREWMHLRRTPTSMTFSPSGLARGTVIIHATATLPVLWQLCTEDYLQNLFVSVGLSLLITMLFRLLTVFSSQARQVRLHYPQLLLRLLVPRKPPSPWILPAALTTTEVTPALATMTDIGASKRTTLLLFASTRAPPWAILLRPSRPVMLAIAEMHTLTVFPLPMLPYQNAVRHARMISRRTAAAINA